MKKRLNWIFITLICLLLSSPCISASNRAVSLRVLDSTLKSGKSRFAESLCGITRISGYVIDKENRDIVLVGKMDPDYPPLHLDDFIVALRNVNFSYAQKKGNTGLLK